MTMLSPSPLAVVSDLATAPDVSVVIPFYRAQSTLGRALASVAAQTQPVQEVIIVDDASGPEAAAVLARIVSDWPHLAAKIVTLPANAGAGAARNAGWAASAGAFVAFLDADDAWHPRKIEIQSHYLRNHDEVDVCGHAHCHALAQQLQADASPVPDDLATLFRAASANIGRFSILLRNPFVTPSVMLRRDLAQRFDDGQRHMEDHRLWMRMVLSGVRVRRLGLALVTLFKPSVGASGLSGDVRRMQAADLENYRVLRQAGFLGTYETWVWLAAARLRHLRRDVLLYAAVVAARRRSEGAIW